MLIHECMECNALSINRIAADDDTKSVLEIFKESLLQGYQIRARCEQAEITMLNADVAEIVYTQLYGREVPALSWR